MKNLFGRLRQSPAFSGLFLLIIALLINMLIQGSSFFSADSSKTLLTKNLPLILAAIAQCIILLTGCIDLSLGFQMTLANVIAIMAPEALGISVAAAWVLAFAAVIAVSTINGIVVSYLRIPPLLATFSMGFILKGITVSIMSKPQGSIPKEIYKFYDGSFLFLPNVLWILVIILLAWYGFTRFPLYRYFLATGGNERNSFLSGINPQSTKVKAYAIAGIFTALSGLALTAMAGSGNPLIGEVFSLKSVAACVIGGTSLSGGWGSAFGAVSGGLFLGIVQNIVFFLFGLLTKAFPGFTFNSYYQSLTADIIVLSGLLLSVVASRKSKKATSSLPRREKSYVN